MSENIIFDANFFICMLSIRARDILQNLSKATEELNYNLHISDLVFSEIKAPKSFLTQFKEIVNVKKVDEKEIQNVKNRLKKSNIRFPAQDNDLSLIALGESLLGDKENSKEIHLVTDDFKLAKNTTLLYPREINILSLSSFLLKIHRSVSKSQMRNYFKNVWKNSLNYTLGYMIERSKIYPAEEKIQWLIERAVSVTEDSIITQDSYLDNEKIKFGIATNKYSEELEIAEKYIEGLNLPRSEEEEVESIINFLENLKISREYVQRSREAIVRNDSKSAVKFLKKGNGFLVSLLQLALGQLEKIKDYELVEQLICSEISKMEFLRAFLLVSLGHINSAIDSLERAALFSTIIHNYHTCLTLNYVKALILLFHGLYDNSILAYNFTEELADVYKDDKLKLKCAIGKAIALYIQGEQEDKETAMAIISEVSDINLEENIVDAIIVFSELGDYFLALGHSQMATNLYNESLEMAIDAGLDWKVDILVEKLKRAYIATVLNGYSANDIVERLDLLLDKAYRVKNVEKYNEQIKKISSFNKLFYTKFPYITGKKKFITYSKIPDELKDEYLEVVHFIKEDDRKILFIISHYDLGLLGLRVKTDENIVGIAENYSLKLKSSAKVKIYEADEDLKEQFLIRAIIEVQGKNQSEINYSLPSFFKQLNL
ncbi:MAG: hypothetical protein GF317_02740 [Candidatus Lokiarchaeota archaeon]|nr:hypothetical protein [Candidatus Lokiarchaeota archaeon]MBD3198824.1 hypothetical protein [Candidatus Lokiarchaeota archaeon]